MQETQVRSLGWEDLLEEEMTTHSGVLAWRIPRTDEPGGLQSVGLQESDTTKQHGLPQQPQTEGASWSLDGRNLRSRCQQAWFSLRPLSLACWWLPSPFVFMGAWQATVRGVPKESYTTWAWTTAADACKVPCIWVLRRRSANPYKNHYLFLRLLINFYNAYLWGSCSLYPCRRWGTVFKTVAAHSTQMDL